MKLFEGIVKLAIKVELRHLAFALEQLCDDIQSLSKVKETLH
jgi:hypothetical protein